MDSRSRAMGLLGGSFDPAHRGHRSIAQSFLKSDCISELWVLLTPESPHKQDQQLTAYDKRMEMLRLTFEGMENVTVTDLEKRLSAPYYTINTLRFLTDHYPNHSFFWCFGEDSLVNFESWHQWEDILDLCNLLVAQRPNFEPHSLNAKISRNTYFIDHEPVDISSTEIRARARENKEIAEFVMPSVANFIKQHNLYQG